MILRIPHDIIESLVYIIYAVIGIIIFLWGRAVGVNQTTEDYKIADTKSEVLLLRQKLQHEKCKNEDLMAKSKLHLNTLSGMRHLMRKGE